jgi:hypothetical protein
MHSSKLPLSNPKLFINGSFRFLSRRKLLRKLVCFALIFNTFLWPGQASTQQWVSYSIGYSVDILSRGLPRISATIFNLLFGPPGRARRGETLTDRLAAVAHIRISPGKFVGYEGEGITLTAHPTDFLDRTIQGVKFTWESSDAEKIQIDDLGRARFLQPGLARITCRAGSAEATAPVLVRPGHRPRQTDEQWQVDQSSLGVSATPGNPNGSSGMGGSLPLLLDKLNPTASAQGSWVSDLGYDQLWSEARNLVGAPGNMAAEPINKR